MYSHLSTSMDSLAPVSVVIPCYRCLQTIERAVHSVLLQTQKPLELILVDDYSADGSIELLYQLQSSYPEIIRVIALEQNLGVANARNQGWQMAAQPYIAFLDADDAWHPKKIALQYAYMSTHPEVVLSGHESKVLAAVDSIPNWDIDPKITTQSISKTQLLLSNPFVTPSVMLKREIRERFNHNQRHMEDHFLWLEVASNLGAISKLMVPLVATYKRPYGESGLSSQLWSMQAGDLSNYWSLFKRNKIHTVQWVALSIFSCLKFIRRILILARAYLQRVFD